MEISPVSPSNPLGGPKPLHNRENLAAAALITDLVKDLKKCHFPEK